MGCDDFAGVEVDDGDGVFVGDEEAAFPAVCDADAEVVHAGGSAEADLPVGVGVRDFIDLWRKDRFEFAVGAVCFLATVLIGAIPGIFVAFILALINLAKRASNPAIDVLESSGDPTESLLEDAPSGSVTAPGVLVIRLGAPLFFANGSVFADAVKSAVTAAGVDTVRHVVIDMEAVNDVDITGAEAIASLFEWLDERHIEVAFSRVREPIRARMTTLGILNEQTIYPTNRSAITALAADPTDAAPQ